MIMKISNFESDIVISDEYVRVLEIEDKELFANIVQSIHCLCYNEEGKEYIVLADEDKEISFQKDVCLIIDILNINFNERKILNNLHAQINSSMEFEVKHELDRHMDICLNTINDLLIEFPFEFTYKSDIGAEDLLKIFNFKLLTEKQSFMEKILYYIDLMSLLNPYKLIVFCNMKAFFSTSQMQEIYKYIIYNKLYVLLLEGTLSDSPLDLERKNRIDEEFEDYEMK